MNEVIMLHSHPGHRFFSCGFQKVQQVGKDTSNIKQSEVDT